MSLIAFNPTGSITHEVSVDGGPFTVFATDTSGDNAFHTPYTPHSFDVNGATTFTLEYVLSNPSGNAILTQAFRETNGDTSTPFLVTTTTAVPEPSTIVALCGLAAMGMCLLIRIRRGK